MLGHEIFGSGAERVIVLNDWLSDTSSWDSARPYLDTAAYTWAFTDLRGYGRSRGQSGAFDLEEAAEDVIALADSLAWPKFHVVGHSMSTLVTLHVAQRFPDRVGRVVLVTPPPPAGFHYDAATSSALGEVALGDDDRRRKALAFMFGTRLSPGWLRFKLARWRQTSEPRAVAGYLPVFGVRGLPDLETRVRCPVLAITGEADAEPMRSGPVRTALAPLAEHLTVEPIVESGHYPMQETPPLFVAKLERFLAEAT